MALHVDTQIVSYAFKQVPGYDVTSATISSVVAKEFLEAYEPGTAPDRYFIPLGSQWDMLAHMQGLRRGPAEGRRPMAKRRTDQLAMDFSGDFASVVEYGSIAFAGLINRRARPLLRMTTAHLPSDNQRRILKRFDFLCEHDVSCVPVTASSVLRSYEILDEFLRRYQPKQNPRNTLNDMLVLGAAVDSRARLITEDGILAEIALKVFPVPSSRDAERLLLDFGTPVEPSSGTTFESKGYINRGWAVSERRGRVPTR